VARQQAFGATHESRKALTMSTIPAGIAELGLSPGDHVCGFYNGSQVRDEVTAAWVKEGALAGHKCVCYFDDSDELVRRIDAEVSEGIRHVEFCDAEGSYAPEGRFSKEAMLARLESAVVEAVGEGYSRVRLLGDMSWIMRLGVDTDTVFAYEAEVNAISPRHPASFMCLYDLDRFDGSLVMEVLRTHSKILLNGMVIQNPYYVPPGAPVAGD
jgi:hypothetical protein